MTDEQIKHPEMVMMGDGLFAGIDEDDVTEIERAMALRIFHDQELGLMHEVLTRLDELDEIAELRKEVKRLRASELEQQAKGAEELTKVFIESVMSVPAPQLNYEANCKMRDSIISLLEFSNEAHCLKLRNQAKELSE